MAVFVEFPTDPIVGVHWAGTPTPNCKQSPPPPALCGNKYGWGGIQGDIGDGFGTLEYLPYGPDQFAPFVGADGSVGGVWNTHAANGPLGANGDGLWGGLGHPYVDADGHQIADTIAAAEHGLVADDLRITESALTFTNAQLVLLQADGHDAGETWTVPMAEGQVCRNLNASRPGTDPNWQLVPVVVKDIEFHLVWNITNNDARDEFGIAIAHELQRPGGGAALGPSEPTYFLGSATAGEAWFKYDFKWKTWTDFVLRQNLLGNPITWDATNNFDPSFGGPVYFLWMLKPWPLTTWQTEDARFAPTTPAINDWYTWEAITTCVATSDAE